LGDQDSGERDVFKLTQVAKVVICRQALFTCPTQGFGQPALFNPEMIAIPVALVIERHNK
jgi:hypothetical protein